MDKESFIGAFNEWGKKYKDVLNERVHDKRLKRHTPPYMRPRLRSAYLSLKRNMTLLWTFWITQKQVCQTRTMALKVCSRI